MRRLHEQAIISFLIPFATLILVGIPYVITGQLTKALVEGPTLLDLVVWAMLIPAMLLPPIWGYRQSAGMAEALSHSTDRVRRVVEGDFSRPPSSRFTEAREFMALEQGISATAQHLKERLVELDEKKLRLEVILATMAEGVLLVDAQKRLLLINPAAEIMFGISAASAIGKDHLEVIYHFQLDERLERVIQTGQPEILEMKRATPAEMVLEGRITPVSNREHALHGVLIVLRDITRSRLLEQMRTEFVSNVTHELRTPLTAIRGFSETLLDGALDDPEAARQFVGIIHRESEHLGRLIEDLLDLSRIESGKWKMHREPVHIKPLVTEIIARLSPQAERLGVRLTAVIPPDLPVISGDHGRLAQVLINLIDNALKYTPPGGSVTVTVAESESALSLSIADTGVGIPKEDLPRIFERFYRVDKARSRSTGGTGLGLSIVRHIVEAHGGTVRVTSAVGKGSTFTFTVPKY